MPAAGEVARPLLEAALVIARETGDRNLESRAQNSSWQLGGSTGPTQRGPRRTTKPLCLWLERLVTSTRRVPSLAIWATCATRREAWTLAGGTWKQLSRWREKAGNRRLEGNTFCNLGLLHLVHGRLEEARGQLGASLAVARDLGHALLECIVLCNLGIVYDGMAQPDEAQEDYEAALDIARELGRQTLGGSDSWLLGTAACPPGPRRDGSLLPGQWRDTAARRARSAEPGHLAVLPN